jgi:hypothetical protein
VVASFSNPALAMSVLLLAPLCASRTLPASGPSHAREVMRIVIALLLSFRRSAKADQLTFSTVKLVDCAPK